MSYLSNLSGLGTSYNNYSSLLGSNSNLSGLTDLSSLTSGLYGSNLSSLTDLSSLGLGNLTGSNSSSLYGLSGLTSGLYGTNSGTSSQADLGQMMQQMFSLFQSMMSGLGSSGNDFSLQNAQGFPGPSPQQFLSKADTDGNGSISQDEFNNFSPQGPNGQTPPQPSTEMKEKMFEKLDTDGDGSISQEELQNAPPPPPRPQNFSFGTNQTSFA